MQTGISDQTFNLDIVRCVRVRTPSVVQMRERQSWRVGPDCKSGVSAEWVRIPPLSQKKWSRRLMGDRSTFTAQTTDRNRSGLQNSTETTDLSIYSV